MTEIFIDPSSEFQASRYSTMSAVSMCLKGHVLRLADSKTHTYLRLVDGIVCLQVDEDPPASFQLSTRSVEHDLWIVQLWPRLGLDAFVVKIRKWNRKPV